MRLLFFKVCKKILGFNLCCFSRFAKKSWALISRRRTKMISKMKAAIKITPARIRSKLVNPISAMMAFKSVIENSYLSYLSVVWNHVI
jgi:hypothetical protein